MNRRSSSASNASNASNATRVGRVLVACLSLAVALLAASCKKGPELTCKVNDQCFVCPDAKAKASCPRDPTSSRCKWAEPSHCK